MKITYIIYFALLLLSCDNKHVNKSQVKPLEKIYCTYHLTLDEFNAIGLETSQNYNPYLTENSSAVFLEIYDIVKTQVDSSKVYELSLVKLKPNEVWLDLKVPKKCDYIEEIICCVMTSKFSNIVPRQLKIRIFEWTERFEKKETNILVGVKKIK